MAAFIEIENLEHEYRTADGKGHKALAGISLSIGKGEFVAVLGANGSGKSTLARHLNGLLLPSAGQVRIDGLSTLEAAEKNELWKIRSQVGMVFQNPDNQLIAAIVEDDVAFGPENLGVEPVEIRQRVTEALQAVGMARFRKRAPHLLSGGQKQRVAIAGALAMETDCLVLDEPTAMLDPQGRKEVLEVVKRLHREKGLTVILITHFMEEAMAAQRVLVMDQGRAVMEGTPREIFVRTKELKALGLEAPMAGELAERLRKAGIPLPQEPGILTAEELLASLQALRGKGHVH
ncbi:energy-coupling factor transporter ATPase [Selenomonas sp. AB3002]|uniref:energy-coupling factor transporter ATPase n=1 Tax=Selenomonas sp. AB3002 TaxID=1392502 RepID=UPI000496A3F0